MTLILGPLIFQAFALSVGAVNAWIFLFWVSIFLILYTYCGYPLLLTLLGWIFKKPVAKRDIFPSVSLVIPAFNEEKVICAKLKNCLQLDYPAEKLEIVVASESTDRTDEIVASFAPRVAIRKYERCGKAPMLFRTVPSLRGEVIVFSDANSMYDLSAIQALVRNFADPEVGCVSGRLFYYVGSQPAAVSESFYWRYENWIKRLESRMQSLMGANGSIFALRRELYAPLSERHGDDFELSVQVLLAGKGVIHEEEAVSHEEPPNNVRSEFRRRMRHAWFVSSLVLLGRAMQCRRWRVILELVSHKLLRWLLLPFLIVSFVSNAIIFRLNTFFLFAFIAQIVFFGLATFGWMLDNIKIRVPKAFLLPYYFCALHTAVFWRTLTSMKRPAYWDVQR